MSGRLGISEPINALIHFAVVDSEWEMFFCRSHVLFFSPIMNYLPEEINLEIFSHLDPKSLIRVPRVCKRLNAILSNDLFWKRIFYKQGYDKRVSYSNKFSFKDCCLICIAKTHLNVAFLGNENCGRKTLINTLLERTEDTPKIERALEPILSTRFFRLQGDKFSFNIFDIPSARKRRTEIYQFASQVCILLFLKLKNYSAMRLYLLLTLKVIHLNRE